MAEPQIAAPETVLAFWREAGPDKWFTARRRVRRRDPREVPADLRGRRGRQAVDLGGDRRGRARARASCSISSRATCSAAMRAPMRPTRSRGSRQPRAQARLRSGRAGRDARLLLPAVHALGGPGRSGALRRSSIAKRASEDLKYAEQHRDIIRRFGRFPHRNAMLGRATTPEEQAFLDDGGFKG